MVTSDLSWEICNNVYINSTLQSSLTPSYRFRGNILEIIWFQLYELNVLGLQESIHIYEYVTVVGNTI